MWFFFFFYRAGTRIEWNYSWWSILHWRVRGSKEKKKSMCRSCRRMPLTVMRVKCRPWWIAHILQNLLNFSRNGTGEERKQEGALKQSSRFHPSPASVWNPSHCVLNAFQWAETLYYWDIYHVIGTKTCIFKSSYKYGQHRIIYREGLFYHGGQNILQLCWTL